MAWSLMSRDITRLPPRGSLGFVCCLSLYVCEYVQRDTCLFLGRLSRLFGNGGWIFKSVLFMLLIRIRSIGDLFIASFFC